MAGRLGIDFGTSNTVLALWDTVLRQAVPLPIPEYSQEYHQGSETIPIIPSLVHYSPDQRTWIGDQVLRQRLAEFPAHHALDETVYQPPQPHQSQFR